MTAVAGSRTAAATWPAAGVPDDPLALLPRGATVAVAMSGGVDSSVAAAVLAVAGVRCFGITLAMWPRDRVLDRDRGCCSVDAVEDARRVCARVGIPHFSWNLEEGFRAAVISAFEAGYASGSTPNPCVSCNERVKFGLLLERALAAGATHVATGHYARAGRRDGRATLHRARDGAKDQAYTLHRVAQRALRRAVFPLGAFESKAAVRAEAARLGLPTAAKPDSQELCFVDGSVREHLARRLEGRFAAGEVVDEAGETVGRHDGLPFLTVGQRSGLHVRPRRPDAPPLHVLRIDVARNRVVVGPRSALLRDRVDATDCTWVDRLPAAGTRVEAQLRAHGAPCAGVVRQVAGGRVGVDLEHPVAAVAPGQSLVLAVGDEVLGGGIIEDGAPWAT